MYKSIRKKVASTVAGIEKSEDFAWGKWLKAPHVNEHHIEGFETSVIDTSEYNSWLQKPSFQKKTFNFKETFVFPEIKNLRPKKLKTHAVFFGLQKIGIKKIDLFDKVVKSENKPGKIEFTNFNLKVKEIKWDAKQVSLQEVEWELRPDILKIDLLSSESLTSEKFKSKESKVDFSNIKPPHKIYKVKFTNLDKIKLSKIYYLKNISLHEVRILRESISLLDLPVLSKEDLKYFVTEEERLPEIWYDEPVELENKSAEQESELKNDTEVSDKSIEQQMAEILSDTKISDDIEIKEEKETEPENSIESEQLNDKETENPSFEGNEITAIEETDKSIPIPEQIENSSESEDQIDTHLEKNIKEERIEPEEKKNTDAVEKDEEEEEEYEYNFDSLLSFQEEGAEFLLENKRAVLCDEMGMGKTNQAAAALKNLFTNKKIKNAIIVCEQNEMGSWGKIPGNIDGWFGHIKDKLPEQHSEVLTGNLQERSKQWKNLPEILITSYESFIFDFGENFVDAKELKKNTCFIFDEVQNIFEYKDFNKQKFLKSFNPRYLWLLSSFPEEELKEISDIFKDKISVDKYLRRTRKEAESELPKINWQNKWLSLDEEQVEEYKEAFANAKEKVQWFLESGNPLRFNANVFTLIHQLKQVCNFSEKKGKSRKTKVLTEQVIGIAKNNQKVVIFTQYEKAGVKKIEEVLKNNKIKFLSYAPGLSTKDMETVLKKFNSSNVTALVVGVKPSRIKIPITNVAYIIHFDLWWNPASLWQTEEVIFGSVKENEKQELNVYSYLMKDTIEEKVHSLLYKKGFLNKNIMETVNPDSITEMITNPEWLEIFDMPDEEYRQRSQKGFLETEKRINNYSPDEFIERGKTFFTKLGYKNLDISVNKTGESYDVRGIYKKAKYDQQMCARFILKDSVKQDEVKQYLSELKEITNNGKYFLITTGVFDCNDDVKSSEILIDRDKLINYFYQFIII